jgi:hypothetical protein
MGGFVVTMVYGFSRATGDLDVFEIAPGEAGRPMLELGMQGGPLHQKYKIYLEKVGVAQVPENYEDRLKEIFPGVFKHLRLMAFDPYDLALSKLERNIQRDRDDVLHLARTVINTFRESPRNPFPNWRDPTLRPCQYRSAEDDLSGDQGSSHFVRSRR